MQEVNLNYDEMFQITDRDFDDINNESKDKEFKEFNNFMHRRGSRLKTRNQ